MKTQGFERRFSQNLAPVSREKPQNLYFAYISNLFSKPELEKTRRDNPKENPTTAMGRLGFPVITLILRS